MLTKLVNEKQNDWDEHLGAMLFDYRTVYKVSIGHTPFQPMYGLNPFMPINYIVPIRDCYLVNM
jgi:hypothetical protein